MCYFCMKWISNLIFQIAVFCDPQCVHGACTGPGQCTCEVGWTSHACDIGEWTWLALVSLGKRINGIIIKCGAAFMCCFSDAYCTEYAQQYCACTAAGLMFCMHHNCTALYVYT